jgi:hypothetical protein
MNSYYLITTSRHLHQTYPPPTQHHSTTSLDQATVQAHTHTLSLSPILIARWRATHSFGCWERKTSSRHTISLPRFMWHRKPSRHLGASKLALPGQLCWRESIFSVQHRVAHALRWLHPASSPSPAGVLAAPRDCEAPKDRAMLRHRNALAGIRTTSRAAPPCDYAPMRGDLVGGECAAIRGRRTLGKQANRCVQRVDYHYGLCASCEMAGGVCQWPYQALPNEWA